MSTGDTSVEVSVVDIDRAELRRRGHEIFPELERGTIFYVHETDEIGVLTEHVLSLMHGRAPAERVGEIRDFFASGREMSRGALRELLLCLRDLRDVRYLSCLFSDFIGSLGLPSPTLIDTGYFRCVFPRHAQALSLDPRVPADIHSGTPPGPEAFLHGFSAAGNPHRDVDTPHYTFQVNIWFPLHDIEADNSLLFFPDVYTKNVPYQVPPENPHEPESWGYGRPLCRAMGPGDVILFHSQHFHASPTKAPNRDRLTAELRMVGACFDDNGSIYRRLFWNGQNFPTFAGQGRADAATRATRLYPSSASFDSPLSPQELLASVMTTPQAVRLTGNLWTRDAVFSATRRLPLDAAETFVARLMAAPFADDRQLWLVRYLLFHGYGGLAERVLMDVAVRSRLRASLAPRASGPSPVMRCLGRLRSRNPRRRNSANIEAMFSHARCPRCSSCRVMRSVRRPSLLRR